MPKVIPYSRPHLATLAEAVNILRDALRDFFSSRMTQEILLAIIDPNARYNEEKEKLKECRSGNRDIRDVIDINIIYRSRRNLIDKIPSLDPSTFNKMRDYRNWVCHPDYVDISRENLKKSLRDICTILNSIGATSESNVVRLLCKRPFTSSHYFEAKYNREYEQQQDGMHQEKNIGSSSRFYRRLAKTQQLSIPRKRT